MRLGWKLVTGCVFILGIGLGLMVATVLWWFFTGSGVEQVVGGGGGGTTASEQLPGMVPAPGGAAGEIEQIILDDPDLMSKLQALCEVPEIKALLEDEEILEAMKKKQYMKLLRSRKFRAAASHPAMRELTGAIVKEAFSGALDGQKDEE